MVKCILNGKVTIFEETEPIFFQCFVDGKLLFVKNNYTPPEPIKECEIEEVERNVKVIEDCFDENSKPRLKIVYVHTDWSDEKERVNGMWLGRFFDAERDKNDEYCLMTGNNSDPPPRIIVVLQDKDYWPGSELEDPLVLERREKEYKEAFPVKEKPDHKEVNPAHYFGDDARYFGYDGSLSNDDYKDVIRRRYENYTNPHLPGYEFLMENFSHSGLRVCKPVSHLKKLKKKSSHSPNELLLKKRKRSSSPPNVKRFGPNARGNFSLDVPIPKRRVSR